MIQAVRALLPVLAMIWLAACSGSDDNSSGSTTNQSPTSSQEPTKPPLTTQPPNMAPPSTQPPASQPPGSQLPGSTPPGSQPPGSTPPGTGSGSGTFTQGTGFNSHVRQIVMAQDGTHDLYVGGDFTTYNGTAANHLTRLHPNGTVAQSFGQGFDELVYFLGLATDGNNALFAGGGFTQFNGKPVPPLIRLTRTGSLDGGFRFTQAFMPLLFAPAADGSGGIYTDFMESNPNCDNPGCTTLLKIVLLKPDGSLNPAFSTGNGFLGGSPARAEPVSIAALVPASNGKLYVGGRLLTYNGVGVSSLPRLNADGTLDSTFNAPASYAPGVETLALASDGTKDVYFGSRNMFSTRVHDDGEVDPTYAPTVPVVPNVICPAQDGTGDVFLSGFDTVSIVFRLLRLDRNGALVSTFHEPTLGAEPPNDPWVLTIVPVLDGTRDLYIGGTFTTYNGVPVNHIAHIHADGSLASVVN
jgi:hypothetical protein